MAARSAVSAVQLAEVLSMMVDSEEDASTIAEKADAHVREASSARIDGSSPKPT
jgi:hypothetical protein